MKKLVVLLAVFALAQGVSSVGQAASAFDDFSDAVNYSIINLELLFVPTYEIPKTVMHSTWADKDRELRAIFNQPKLHVKLDHIVVEGWAISVDSYNPFLEGTAYGFSEYKPGSIFTALENEEAWNKLQYMWLNADIAGDANIGEGIKRSALQLATWKGAANDWDLKRDDYWATSDEKGAQFWFEFGSNKEEMQEILAANSLLFDTAMEYLAIGRDYQYDPNNPLNDFMLVVDKSGQNETSETFAVLRGPQTDPAAVPEASTLVGFGSAMLMGGPGMLGWLRRRKS